MKEEWKKIQKHLGLYDDGIPGINTAEAVITALEIPNKPELKAEFDARTEKNLATLLPAAERKFRVAMRLAIPVAEELGAVVKIISGNRTFAEQDALFAKGRTKPGRKVTNARGGYSRHNFGIAIDFGLFVDGEYLDGSDPGMAHMIYAAIADKIKPLGIEWGGDWRSFQDVPHFQIATGLSTAQLRERVAKNLAII